MKQPSTQTISRDWEANFVFAAQPKQMQTVVGQLEMP
jgi:hypothetical protein